MELHGSLMNLDPGYVTTNTYGGVNDVTHQEVVEGEDPGCLGCEERDATEEEGPPVVVLHLCGGLAYDIGPPLCDAVGGRRVDDQTQNYEQTCKPEAVS